MLDKSFKSKSIKGIGTALSMSLLAAGVGLSQPAKAADPFIAEIIMFGSNFAPRGWAFCDGQLLAINTNQALFSLLGTTYGGDGRTTFGLPDLRGRTAIGPRQGPGLSSYSLGQRGGLETVALSASQMPSHTHAATATATVTVHATNARGNTADPSGHILASKPRTNIYSDAAPNVTMSPGAASVSIGVTNANAGGSQAHENRMPFIAINHIIALVGVFPSRN